MAGGDQATVLDYTEKIVYSEDRVILYGSVPVKLKAYENSDLAEASKLEFKLSDRISASERLGRNVNSKSIPN